jgi:hypothetical protein
MPEKQFEDDPCWDGYTMVGTKVDESGNEVPRCVPDDDVPDANMAYAADSECPDGKVSINGDCVDVEEVESIPPSALQNSAILASGLNTEPIERVEEGENTVRYKSLSLLTEGVWTDQKSKTPTLYSEEGIAEIQAEYDAEHSGPPVNVMHDVDPESGEVHEPSHGGYVDPNSLAFQNGALMGDVVLDTETSAGAFADDNLQSALESQGRVGFGGPSVELDLDPDEHIHNSDHPQAEKEISGGYLTGLGLVMDPADKNIEFSKETRKRAVAMSGQTDKALYTQSNTMADIDSIRDTMAEAGIDTDEMTDEELTEMAESLHGDLMDALEASSDGEEEEEEEEAEMEEGEEEEEEEKDMMDEEALDVMQDMLDDEMDELWEKVREIEDMVGGAAEEEEMSEAKEELSELKEEKAELEARLSDLEDEPKEPKTLADGDSEDDWYDADGNVQSDTVGF